MDTIEEFKQNIEIMSKVESDRLREEFIREFVDVNDEYYKQYIARRTQYIDGECYTGYLWDCLRNKELIREKDINSLSQVLGDVFVMWDIHTCERIFIEDYWKFDKDTILKLKFETLLQGEKFLPEDIYIFDETFSWCLVKTHEDIAGGRFCLASRSIFKISQLES